MNKQEHWNIGQKERVNPFENIKYIYFYYRKCKRFQDLLDTAKSVETVKYQDLNWIILYPISIFDKNILINWKCESSGDFNYRGDKITFFLSEDMMFCSEKGE